MVWVVSVVGIGIGIVALCAALSNAFFDALAADAKAAAEKRAQEVDDGHPKPNYVGIFSTLLALTIVTIGISRINLGSANNTAIAMLVATFKASLVMLYFMHLKFEKRMLLTVVVIPAFFLAALVIGLSPDLVTNKYNADNGERPGFWAADK